MSVLFDPPNGINQGHLGAFWSARRTSFPKVRSAQPIAVPKDSFGDQGAWFSPSFQITFTTESTCRLQMVSSDDQWMWQIQQDRLVVNWRKRTKDYPRFGATWTQFQDSWQAWQQFLADFGMARLQPRIWELTYVNRIPKGRLWDSPGDWQKIFPGLWGGPGAVLENAKLQGLLGQWVWESTQPFTRLYAEANQGRLSDSPTSDVFLLTLTARGLIDATNSQLQPALASEIPLISLGMNHGHELIVSTFDALASSDAKTTWRRHADPD